MNKFCIHKCFFCELHVSLHTKEKIKPDLGFEPMEYKISQLQVPQSGAYLSRPSRRIHYDYKIS